MGKKYGKVEFEKKTTQPELEDWIKPLYGAVLNYYKYVIVVDTDQNGNFTTAVYEMTNERTVATELEQSVPYLYLVAEAERFFDDNGHAVKWGIEAVDLMSSKIKNAS